MKDLKEFTAKLKGSKIEITFITSIFDLGLHFKQKQKYLTLFYIITLLQKSGNVTLSYQQLIFCNSRKLIRVQQIKAKQFSIFHRNLKAYATLLLKQSLSKEEKFIQPETIWVVMMLIYIILLIFVVDTLQQFLLVSIITNLLKFILLLRQIKKLQKMRVQVLTEIKQHCRNVSISHEKIDISAELYETEKANRLFCLLVRNKAVFLDNDEGTIRF